jgi:hypothetical protein
MARSSPLQITPQTVQRPAVTAVSPHLLQVATPCKPFNPNRGPTKADQYARKPAARAGAAPALGDVQNIEHGLRSDALYTVIPNPAP